MSGNLGVGFIGSGFITRFHIRSWEAVRDADIRGIYSPTRANAEDAAGLARSLRVGNARAFDSIEEMVADPSIDCIWLCGPNFARIQNMERIVAAIKKGAKLKGIACEKPLGRNAAEANRMVQLIEEAGVLHGLSRESAVHAEPRARKQIVWARGAAFAGRPYLARAAESMPAAHAVVLAGRPAGRRRVERHDVPQPRGRPLPAHQAGGAAQQHSSGESLGANRLAKWSRPEYVAMLRGSMTDKVDYSRNPAEDWARATVTYADDAGDTADCRSDHVVEFRRRGAAIVDGAAGPRVLDVGQHPRRRHEGVLFARRLQDQQSGEDLLEKQNAEQGLMPIVGNEAGEYGYENENRSFTRALSTVSNRS